MPKKGGVYRHDPESGKVERIIEPTAPGPNQADYQPKTVTAGGDQVVTGSPAAFEKPERKSKKNIKGGADNG